MKASHYLRSAVSVAALGFAALFLTGCVGVVPLPATSKVQTGHRLTREQVAFIEPGHTTRAEVISQLGTNYLSLPTERAIAYSWEVAGGGGVWWVFLVGPYGGGATGGNWLGGWRTFFVAFDQNQVVTDSAFRSPSPNHSLDEHLYRWCGRLPAKPHSAVSGYALRGP